MAEIPVPKSVTEGSRSLWTTITGVAAGIGYYLSTTGAAMPTTKGEWLNFGVGLFLAALGIGARDAARPATVAEVKELRK